jgi:anaerobic ribonucleoside-triphosphate reductase activating protein
LEKLKNTSELEGITISGGEPFQQPQALHELVQGCSALNKNLSILVYSGYRLEELKAFQDDKIEAILQKIDILIDGRYDKTMFSGDGVRGSTHQSIHFLSNRHKIQDLDENWGRGIQVFINGKELFWAGVPVDSEFSNKFIEKLQKKGIL